MTLSARWQTLPVLRSLDHMSRALHRLGRFAVRRRRTVLLVWLVVAAALWSGATATGGGYSDDFRVPGVESQQALDVLTERFPEAAGGSAQVVVHARDGDLDDPANVRALADLVDRVGDLPRVATVLDPAAPRACRSSWAATSRSSPSSPRPAPRSSSACSAPSSSCWWRSAPCWPWGCPSPSPPSASVAARRPSSWRASSST